MEVDQKRVMKRYKQTNLLLVYNLCFNNTHFHQKNLVEMSYTTITISDYYLLNVKFNWIKSSKYISNSNDERGTY